MIGLNKLSVFHTKLVFIGQTFVRPGSVDDVVQLHLFTVFGVLVVSQLASHFDVGKICRECHQVMFLFTYICLS